MSRARHMKSGTSSVMVPANRKGEPAIQIPGKAVMQESKQKSKGFARGGAAKADAMADGGAVAKARMDKTPRKARGGGVTMRGRSPLSAAASTDAPRAKTTH